MYLQFNVYPTNQEKYSLLKEINDFVPRNGSFI